MVLTIIRKYFKGMGYEVPESDEDLFLLIQAALPQNLCQFCGSVIPPKCTTCFQCGREQQ